MRSLSASLILACALLTPAFAQNSGSPFVGRWDFDVHPAAGVGANWLGVTENGGKLEVWFQPTGGHVIQMNDARVDGSTLTFTAAAATANHPATTWELHPSGDKLTGVQKHGGQTTELTGVRAPELNRTAPKAWSKPERLFNEKNLDGWEPIGDASKSHWVVKDGVLLNEAHGANLKSVRKFDDFKVHFEVNCPEDANSGFYLRGRYEMQLEYVAAGSEPAERSMGAIYGRIPGSSQLPRTPGKWESFDVTLVGRTVTIVRNGVKIIDAKQIEVLRAAPWTPTKESRVRSISRAITPAA